MFKLLRLSANDMTLGKSLNHAKIHVCHLWIYHLCQSAVCCPYERKVNCSFLTPPPFYYMCY